jgi:hypothetical protein
MVHGSLAAKSL